jgi:hypothetical protein
VNATPAIVSRDSDDGSGGDYDSGDLGDRDRATSCDDEDGDDAANCRNPIAMTSPSATR